MAEERTKAGANPGAENFGQAKKNIEEELDEIRAEWEMTKVDLKVAKDGLKSLDKALKEAIGSGADSKTINGIFDQWKSYNDKVTELEKKLIQIDRPKGMPNPFGFFVKKSRENVEKGTKILGSRVDKLKKGASAKESGTLTAAILAEHNKVDSIFHEEQEKAADRLNSDIDKAEIKDIARIDAWIDAITAAEEIENKASSKVASLYAREGQAEASAKSKAEITKESLHKKFNAKEASLKAGDPSRGQRLKGGFKTILDATKGSPYKDYFGTPKTPDDIKAELDKAKAKLEKKEAKMDRRIGLKIGFIKAWASVQKKIECFRAKVARDRAEKAQRNLEKIKNPRAKSVLEEIKKAAAEGKSPAEARESVREGIEKSASEKKGSEPGR